MILIISLCSEKLHDLEFVKPIEKIVSSVTDERIIVRRLEDLEFRDTKRADKIIISGTSLKDFEYWNKFEMFNFLKDYSKPVLGICAGMQIIGRVFGFDFDESDEKKEIGATKVNFEKDFLGLDVGSHEVYSLHKVGIVSVGKDFEVYAKNEKGIQAIKHKEKEIYGVLFHPEVYNPEVIEEFVKQ